MERTLGKKSGKRKNNCEQFESEEKLVGRERRNNSSSLRGIAQNNLRETLSAENFSCSFSALCDTPYPFPSLRFYSATHSTVVAVRLPPSIRRAVAMTIMGSVSVADVTPTTRSRYSRSPPFALRLFIIRPYKCTYAYLPYVHIYRVQAVQGNKG